MKIIGYGGGGKDGGGGGGGGESPDTISSQAFARVLDLVCEGEIEGLVDGDKSIYLDETPLQNSDGSYNFNSVYVETRNGTQGQTYVAGAQGVESENLYQQEFTNLNSVTRSFTNSEVDALRVRISFPALSEVVQSTGAIQGSSVTYAIDLQNNGGGFVEQVSNTVSGKSSRKYEIAHRIELTGNGPWDVRVRRVSGDTYSSLVQNRSYLESITEIVDAKLRYPNSALIGVVVDSAQFQNIPTRGYDLKLIRVKIPSNYNPTTRAYTGIWDGTFSVAWTDNPAWCFYDLVTNARYGLGNFISEDQVDKWALYDIAQYCDELVSDGFGGVEPRFTCNVYFQTRQEAYKMLNDMASIFRAMLYWAGGSILASQDAPSDAVHLYTPANVEDGLFTYQGSSIKARHTVALITWSDPADFYRQKVEYVEDVEGIALYGVVQAEALAFGCTSRGQANRMGRWLLFSEKLQTETVTFKTGLEGAVGRPGQIIKVADPTRAGSRLGGRVKDCTNTVIELDSSVTLAAGVTYTLAVMLEAGSFEERTVTNSAGTYTSLTVSSAFSSAPERMSIWVLSSDALEAQTFRVIGVSETDKGTYEISALAHNESKYATIEQGLVLDIPIISNVKTVPDAPSGAQVSEYLYQTLGGVDVAAVIAWNSVPTAKKYRIVYSVADGNEITLESPSNQIEIRGAATGLYTFRVYTLNAAGIRSLPAFGSGTVYGKSAAPQDVTGFDVTAFNGAAQFSFDEHPDLDVRVGGKFIIRYSSMTSGATWNDAVDVATFSGSSTRGLGPLLNGTYLIKAVDSSGNYSENADLVTTTLAGVLQFNAVATLTESPTFAGVKDGVGYDSGFIKLAGLLDIDDILTDMDDWSTMDFEGGLVSSGTYYFDNSLDLGAVYTSRITAAITALAYNDADLIDLRLNDIDSWDSFDGAVINDATATLFVRKTNDDPSGAPTWSAWSPFLIGDYTARAFEFRIDLYRTQTTSNIKVSSLSVTIDMPDRVEAQNGIVVAAGGSSVTFTNAFRATPAIGITGRDLATGDYLVKTAESATGFTVQFKNAAGTGVSKTIDWIAKGYGYLH
jgi:predicted phage tail protein